jgi:AbrB family looped-hinge helix DNA binding protein
VGEKHVPSDPEKDKSPARRAAARKAVATKRASGTLSDAARKAAETRRRRAAARKAVATKRAQGTLSEIAKKAHATRRGDPSRKVGPKGQVVIPKHIRDAIGIAPGDDVIVEAAGGEARVRPLRAGVAVLRGAVPPSGVGMADWEREKRREREREAAGDRRKASTE